jgi:thermostable 8-oxoguanine DNA glycosylase
LGKLDESRDVLDKTFSIDSNILDDNIEKYIKNYTCEGFYYKNLNKFLREGNFDDFRKLSTHVAKFIFKLYDFREKNLSNQKSTNLYRRMCLKREEIKE